MGRILGSGSTGTRGLVRGLGLLIVTPIMLVGCTSYEKLPEQSYDRDYGVFTATSWSGTVTVFLMKAFESEGKVALCGGYTLGNSSFSTIGNRRWADTSKIYIDQTEIGDAGFIQPVPIYGFKEGQDPGPMFRTLATKAPPMSCVRSKVPWKARYEGMKIERRGPKRMVVED